MIKMAVKHVSYIVGQVLIKGYMNSWLNLIIQRAVVVYEKKDKVFKYLME